MNYAHCVLPNSRERYRVWENRDNGRRVAFQAFPTEDRAQQLAQKMDSYNAGSYIGNSLVTGYTVQDMTDSRAVEYSADCYASDLSDILNDIDPR